MTKNIIPGQLIGGRYLVESLLGRGAMASVYRAVHVATERPCALKVALLDRALLQPLSASFIDEARIGGRIGEHPHIVCAFDAGVDDPTGRPFLAMPLLEGETLEARLERGPFASEDVEAVMRQVAGALQQAHDAGVVHRDLKPSNLFLVEGRDVLSAQVLDFGLAKVLAEGEAAGPRHTGTLGYGAPEQLGDDIRRAAAARGIIVSATISPATDVWALALVAYEMLTGHAGWQYWKVSTSAELPMVVATVTHPASERAGDRADLLPSGFDEWFERATKKNAAERTPSVTVAAAELTALLTVGTRRSVMVTPSRRAGTTLPPLSEPPPRLEPRPTPPLEQLHDAVARRPLDSRRLHALFDALGSDADRRSRVAQVLVVIDAADAEQRALARQSVASPHIRPRRPLSPELLATHLHHPDEGPITAALLSTVSRALLATFKHHGGDREDASRRVRDDELARCFAWAATVLSMREPLLYRYPTQRVATRLTADHPPDLRLGGMVSPALSPRELAFVAGRGVATTAPARMMRWLVADVRTLKDALAAAVSVVAPEGMGDDPAMVGPIADALRNQLTGPEIQALRREYARFVEAGGRTHVGMWAEGAQHTAARAGLLLCDDIAVAAKMLERERTPDRQRLVRDLIGFFTSRDYRVLRAAMGLAPPAPR